LPGPPALLLLPALAPAPEPEPEPELPLPALPPFMGDVGLFEQPLAVAMPSAHNAAKEKTFFIVMSPVRSWQGYVRPRGGAT
jgi:hypothetical protein